ncbi:MAG: helix-turn-helix transcriptional regulator, partial [Candidatus Thorarchaeota archaeon]
LGQVEQMSRADSFGKRIDVVLVLVSIIILTAALAIWIIALPISRETVILAVTIALVISLILVLNAAILVVLRLQRRVTQLEDAVTTKSDAIEKRPEELVVVVTLTNTERRIINRLEDNGGFMAQDELRRATGMSKSTLSVTLSTLERKSLVSRETSGRTKIVRLSRKVTR